MCSIDMLSTKMYKTPAPANTLLMLRSRARPCGACRRERRTRRRARGIGLGAAAGLDVVVDVGADAFFDLRGDGERVLRERGLLRLEGLVRFGVGGGVRLLARRCLGARARLGGARGAKAARAARAPLNVVLPLTY